MLTVTATDTAKATATQTFKVTVVANQTPTAVGTIPGANGVCGWN